MPDQLLEKQFVSKEVVHAALLADYIQGRANFASKLDASARGTCAWKLVVVVTLCRAYRNEGLPEHVV